VENYRLLVTVTQSMIARTRYRASVISHIRTATTMAVHFCGPQCGEHEGQGGSALHRLVRPTVAAERLCDSSRVEGA
jgi:hypothetical protein